MAIEDWVIGGEGDITLNGTKWCQSTFSLNFDTTDQDINNACDFDATLRMTWGRSVPTGIRMTGEFTVDLNKNRDVLGTDAGNIFPNKEYTGTIELYSGKTITGTFLVGGISLTNNGVMGVMSVTIPIKSQGAVVITNAA